MLCCLFFLLEKTQRSAAVNLTENSVCTVQQVGPVIRNSTLTLRLLMSHIYGAPILDVSRSHTTTHHSR